MNESQLSPSLFDLLSNTDEIDTIETMVCETCDADVPVGVETCPECGGRTELPTIAELGKRLPIGVEINGALEKSFDLIPLSWEIERKIGKDWAKRRNNIDVGSYIGVVLANTVTKIAQYEISKMPLEKRLLIFNEMFAADIFYMYAYLRLISSGKDLQLKGIRCVSDAHSFMYTADVSTLGVVCFESIEKFEKKIKLENGFEMGGSHRDTLIIRPTKWNMMSEPLSTGNPNSIEMFGAMLINSVVEIVGLERGALMSELQLKQMSKPDLEICREAMDQVLGGPRWFIEGECPICGEEFYFELDWTYENFFARSYTSRRRRKRSKKQRK